MNTESIKQYLSEIETAANSLIKACAVLNKQLEGITSQAEERKLDQERHNQLLISIEAKKKELKEVESKKNAMNEEIEQYKKEKELLEKEKAIDRERKLSLDAQEAKLKERANKIQQIFGD